MDIIEMTRELGRALQNDERYIAMMAARQASDEDEALQEAIGEFNLKRMAISNEAQKEERDDETLRRLNDEFRAVYQKIMENEHMLRYNDAKNEFDALLQQMTGHPQPVRRGRGPRHLRRVLLRRQLRQLRRLPLRNIRDGLRSPGNGKGWFSKQWRIFPQ